jgi:REP element-mobilizing transposase RayT
MTRVRRELVHSDTTPYYPCICRCVRRAFLCGQDAFSGKSYEHRKHWVLEHLGVFRSVYAVDICAYAVMSNHYHLVVRVDPELARGWSIGPGAPSGRTSVAPYQDTFRPY